MTAATGSMHVPKGSSVQHCLSGHRAHFCAGRRRRPQPQCQSRVTHWPRHSCVLRRRGHSTVHDQLAVPSMYRCRAAAGVGMHENWPGSRLVSPRRPSSWAPRRRHTERERQTRLAKLRSRATPLHLGNPGICFSVSFSWARAPGRPLCLARSSCRHSPPNRFVAQQQVSRQHQTPHSSNSQQGPAGEQE